LYEYFYGVALLWHSCHMMRTCQQTMLIVHPASKQVQFVSCNAKPAQPLRGPPQGVLRSSLQTFQRHSTLSQAATSFFSQFLCGSESLVACAEPTRPLRGLNNAYMLVYIRCSDWDRVMQETDKMAIDERVRAVRGLLLQTVLHFCLTLHKFGSHFRFCATLGRAVITFEPAFGQVVQMQFWFCALACVGDVYSLKFLLCRCWTSSWATRRRCGGSRCRPTASFASASSRSSTCKAMCAVHVSCS
jgi:hypothetical protein